ncbi:MAG: hypothetical protein ACSLFM_01290 [Tepidiformaceae bacterium]
MGEPEPDSAGNSGARIRILAASDALRGALAMRLAEARTIAPSVTLDGAMERGDIAVVSALDYPPPACNELVRQGIRVVVLAPVARESDREEFMQAGVYAYLPMAVDADELVDHLEGALRPTASSSCTVSAG